MDKTIKRQVNIRTTPDYQDNPTAPYKWEILKEGILEDYGWSETLELAFDDAEYTLKKIKEE